MMKSFQQSPQVRPKLFPPAACIFNVFVSLPPVFKKLK